MNSPTWSGVIVAPGTATVRVVQNGETFNLSTPIEVTPRNWAWMPVPPTQVADQAAESIEVFPSPPVPGGRIGAARLDQRFAFVPAVVTDNGPNQGVRFVDSASDANSGIVPTQYLYQLSSCR